MPKVLFESEDLHQELTNIICSHMSHSGVIYGMPQQQLKEREKLPAMDWEEGDEEDHQEDEGNEEVTKGAVAEQAAEAILNAELPKFVEMIRREFREKGLDAVYKWYPAE